MSSRLALPEKTRLKIGYLRLTDSAPLLVAAELGLYQRYRLSVELQQEVSWANVRDKLAVGGLDAAQMLAPLPAMTTLGVSGIRVPMLSGLTLSRNGNTIALAAPLWHEVRMRCQGDPGAASAARAFRAAAIGRSGKPPVLAVVHPFSTHAILLRLWLQAGGVDPDRDVRTVIVPPAQMVDSLASGIIDGFCVGEPWGSVAVRHGVGAIVAIGSDLWPDSPEKVLCVTERWHDQHPATHLRLRLALMEACAWLADPANAGRAAQLLSAPGYLDLPADWLLPALTGCLRLEPRGQQVTLPRLHRFGAGIAGCPWRIDAETLIDRCGGIIGRPLPRERIAELAQRTSRPGLFRQSARYLGIEVPAGDDSRRRAPAPSSAAAPRRGPSAR